jgi:hypothetical protein
MKLLFVLQFTLAIILIALLAIFIPFMEPLAPGAPKPYAPYLGPGSGRVLTSVNKSEYDKVKNSVCN